MKHKVMRAGGMRACGRASGCTPPAGSRVGASAACCTCAASPEAVHTRITRQVSLSFSPDEQCSNCHIAHPCTGRVRNKGGGRGVQGGPARTGTPSQGQGTACPLFQRRIEASGTRLQAQESGLRPGRDTGRGPLGPSGSPLGAGAHKHPPWSAGSRNTRTGTRRSARPAPRFMEPWRGARRRPKSTSSRVEAIWWKAPTMRASRR